MSMADTDDTVADTVDISDALEVVEVEEKKPRAKKKTTSKFTVRVFYPGNTPKLAGLRLEPGWNEVPTANGSELVARGICLDREPGGKE